MELWIAGYLAFYIVKVARELWKGKPLCDTYGTDFSAEAEKYETASCGNTSFVTEYHKDA
jgi:hypothetical protein